MPARTTTKMLKMERRLCEAAELDALQLRRTLESQAGQRPHMYRRTTLRRHWRCHCGNLVWSSKTKCPMCSLSRCYGTTAVGSVRGVMQSTAAVVQARGQQRLDPGFGVSQHGHRQPQSARSGADASAKHQPNRYGQKTFRVYSESTDVFSIQLYVCLVPRQRLSPTPSQSVTETA